MKSQILTVKILEARNVRLKLTKGAETVPALYCLVRSEAQEVRTPVFAAKNALEAANPKWDYSINFDVTDLETDLSIAVYDEHNTAPGYLGRVTVPLSTIKETAGGINKWLEIHSQNKDTLSGEISVQAKLAAVQSKVSLDDLDLLCVIGKGSFGKVLQVRKKDSQRIYAMKILKKEDIIARQEVEHTRSEQHLMRILRHPFIVGLKYSFQTEDKLYMVMDYVNGGELFYHLKKERCFSEERARFYAAEITLALEHIHLHNTVYRDLKPENILLDYSGHVCLTDFGLCKEGLEYGKLTNTFCGTAEYLAPEVLEGRGYGKAVDWWSLGTLLYEMLTGGTPFYSSNTNNMYKKILAADLKCPDTFSRDVTSILHLLLKRRPEERLGGGPDDAKEVKAHPFFRDINWAKLAARKVTPPWQPEVKSSADISNIDPEFTSERVLDSLVDSKLAAHEQIQFSGFTYVDDTTGTMSVRNGQFSLRGAPLSLQP